jgi:hypothetical protein
VVVGLVAVSVLAACAGSAGGAPDAGDGSVTLPSGTASSTVGPVTTSTTLPSGTALFSFATPASVEGWFNQNDTVMGGVSLGTASWADGALVFSGDLSLDNGGGFTSVVSSPDPALGLAAAGAAGLVVDASGDGRTYTLQLRAADGRRWVQSFTPAIEGGEVVLPLDGFTAVDFRLDPVAPTPVDPSALDSMALYLVDGVEGPFRLAVAAILAR